MIQITYALSQRDFFESLIAIRNCKPWAKWGYRAASALLVCLSVFSVLRSPRSQSASLIPLMSLLALWAFLLWASPWLSARTQFLKQPSVQRQRTVSFEGDAVIWHWDGGSIVVEWKTYTRWIESKNQIVLCSSVIQSGIVPKRALNTEQLPELRTLLTQKIGAGIRV